MLLVSYLRIWWQIKVMKIYPYLFLKDFYDFSSYIYVTEPFWVNFYEWHEVGVSLHFLTGGNPVFPEPLVIEIILFLVNIFGTLVQNQLAIWVCFWILNSILVVYISTQYTCNTLTVLMIEALQYVLKLWSAWVFIHISKKVFEM